MNNIGQAAPSADAARQREFPDLNDAAASNGPLAVRRFTSLGDAAHPTAAQLLNHSREVLSAARLEAQNLVAETKKLLDAEYQRLSKEALEQASREAALKLLTQGAASIKEAVSSRSLIVDLVFAVAKQVIGLELKTNPDSIVARVNRAITAINEQGTIHLAVNPDDEEAISIKLSSLKAALPPQTELKIKADPAILRGDAVLETCAGAIQASVNAHFQALKTHIKRQFLHD